jgi:hypothetical protein
MLHLSVILACSPTLTIQTLVLNVIHIRLKIKQQHVCPECNVFLERPSAHIALLTPNDL